MKEYLVKYEFIDGKLDCNQICTATVKAASDIDAMNLVHNSTTQMIRVRTCTELKPE